MQIFLYSNERTSVFVHVRRPTLTVDYLPKVEYMHSKNFSKKKLANSV